MGSRYRGAEREERALDAFVKLMRASDAVVRRLTEGLEGQALTHAQIPVLEALYFVGPMCQADLGRKLLRSASNVTGMVDALEERGLVARTRRTEDRRVIDVSLTDAGRDLIERVFPLHARNVADAFAGLTADEQATLAALCKKLGLSATT
jgi:MarR family 2-MHQ and catechol resistance regulon transcriptional repressor